MKKVLFINQEITPYVADTPMSLAGNKLPLTMVENGHEIRIFMPKWGCINERRSQLHEVIRLSGMNLIIDGADHQLIIKVSSIPNTRIQVYFIDNPDYFSSRKNMTVNEKGIEYKDNGERAIFFARGVLETVKKLRWIPNVIHCQGWMSAILPYYIKTVFKDEPCFADAKIVTSLFNNDLTGNFSRKFKKSIKFNEATSEILDNYKSPFNCTELVKLAIDYSDAIVEAVPDLCTELKDYSIKRNIPILNYQEDENLGTALTDFYESL